MSVPVGAPTRCSNCPPALSSQSQAGAITSEVLKQLCPHEAALLADPTLEPVVRFRCGMPVARKAGLCEPFSASHQTHRSSPPPFPLSPSLRRTVRARFGAPGFGSPSFPPDILYKVFLTRDGSSLVYLSGKKMIKPASDAAVDSLGQMGRRKFIDQMVEDSLQHERTGVQDELDVTSMKECVDFCPRLRLRQFDELGAVLWSSDLPLPPLSSPAI